MFLFSFFFFVSNFVVVFLKSIFCFFIFFLNFFFFFFFFFFKLKKTKQQKKTVNGMKGLHSENIIHRDLKPANLMILRNGKNRNEMTIKIIDFTTAKFYSENLKM